MRRLLKLLVIYARQHRLAGLEAVVQRRIQGSRADEVPNDDISVVFISLDGNMPKVRHIFNKVNRYAKTTSRGDNIVTSEEDGIALSLVDCCERMDL